MTIVRKAAAATEEPTREQVLIRVDGRTDVVSDAMNFNDLQLALKELMETLRQGERFRVRGARILDAIERQELYRQVGFESMKAFFPYLIEQMENFGWKSGTSIKRYLAWYRLYLKQLQLDADAAVASVSHLHNLYVLAHLDRKTGELDSPEKPGKLEPEVFEDITRLVTTLVGGLTPEGVTQALGSDTIEQLRQGAGLPEGMSPVKVINKVGLSPEDTRKLLGSEHLAQTYQSLMGEEVRLPEGGWQLADTQRIIDRVRKEEEEEDEEKLTQVWCGYETADEAVFIERIEFRNTEGALFDTIAVQKTYSTARLKKLVGKNKTEIAGQDGENENAEE